MGAWEKCYYFQQKVKAIDDIMNYMTYREYVFSNVSYYFEMKVVIKK